jgi:hypothetical protein
VTIEQLWRLLDSIQGQIRAFDTKAQVAIGLDSLLAGLLGTELVKGLELAKWHFGFTLVSFLGIATLSITGLLLSSIFAVLTIVPRLHLDQPKSHFFFCHLVDLYGRKFHAAEKGLIALTEDQKLHQLASQVQTNSVICDVKASRCRRSLWLMIASLLLYVLTFWPYGVLAYRSGTAASVAVVPCSSASTSQTR